MIAETQGVQSLHAGTLKRFEHPPNPFRNKRLDIFRVTRCVRIDSNEIEERCVNENNETDASYLECDIACHILRF